MTKSDNDKTKYLIILFRSYETKSGKSGKEFWFQYEIMKRQGWQYRGMTLLLSENNLSKLNENCLFNNVSF